MDISSARLAALLREAIAPQAVPSAKADPVKAALVKALVAPPAPSGAPVRPAAAPTLPMLILPATTVRAQQTASAEMLQAYLALAEPAGETTGDAAATAASTSADGDTRRGLAPPPARFDEAAARPTALRWLAILSPEVPALRRATVANAVAGQGRAASRSNDVARPESRQMSVGLTSLAAGLLVAAIVGFVLLVLR
ncbi:hypothetical protein NKI20_01230 [Mesorhizobium sp. M0830]|uniref:hypothetical protein n=1 Tax=Mesorhizobium sp. M0830 TaxID=2957008 RepID=UPI00333B7808